MTRVAFDGSILGAGPITGVAGSFLTTLRHYAEVAPFECVLLVPAAATVPDVGVESVECLQAGRRQRLRSLRRACRDLDAALLHSPVTAVPGRNPCPIVATVHDLPWLHRATRGEAGSGLLRRLAAHLAARTAQAIVVPSTATRDDLLRGVRIDAGKVHVIPHGVEPVAAAAAAAAGTDTEGPFLVLGDDRPRKNCVRVARAHALARAQDPSLPDLAFLGPGHASGYVPEADKVRRLRAARALLHLALLEGFGLPVLEAFAHGVPVVCSNTTSLPEVAGDAAVQVDPTDIAAMAAAIRRIHDDTELRETLRERGRARALAFAVDHTAAAWLALHRSILDR